MVNVLCVGDVVGKSGREVLRRFLPDIQRDYAIDITIVNVENSAGGFGINAKTYQEFESLKINGYTSGNHVFDKKEIFDQLPRMPKLIRPLNLPPGTPGNGSMLIEAKGIKLAVVNLMGRVFMPMSDCPFQCIQRHLETIREITPFIFIDFHAEATSEKQAMGWFLDGKVSCVFGTHTHVMTADNTLLNQGTAYISDLGMVGGKDAILGMEKEAIIQKFFTQLPSRFEPSTKSSRLFNAVKVAVDSQGKAVSIERIQKEWVL